MNGHVRKKNGRWYYTIELAPVNGKRQRIERAGGKTKKEAMKKMHEAIEEYYSAGRLIEESNLSVSDYMDYWFDNYCETNLKLNTKKYYSNIIRLHIKPALGSYHLSSISAATLQQFINSKKAEGYSKNHLSSIKGLLSSSFRMAVHPYGFLKENPAQYVKMPRYDQVRQPEDLKIITTDEFKRIIEKFPEGHRFYIPLQIGFNCGLRAGEVCGLTWDCIDLKNQKLKVEKTLLNGENGTYFLGTPKTKNSYRSISMSKQLTQMLKAYKKRQMNNRLKLGEFYEESNMVCTWENGKVITTEQLKYLSRVVNKQLHIRFNFHSLRHTHASMLLAAGVNIKAIQERLGHNNISTTLDTYSHITKQLEEKTNAILDQLSI